MDVSRNVVTCTSFSSSDGSKENSGFEIRNKRKISTFEMNGELLPESIRITGSEAD